MLVDRAPRVLDDGIVTVDVRFTDELPVLDDPHSEPAVALLVRYRNPQGYYAVGISNNDIALYRRTSSGFEQVAYGSISVTGLGITQKLQVTTDGNRLIVFWNGEYIFHWDDPNPWLTGKIGFRHRESHAVEWDNIRVTTGGPGKVVAYDDYDPWGMVLEGRSGNAGSAEARFKFTGKERDTETGYDWLSARGYDARIGRFMTVDPHASSYPSLTPYHYAGNNPVAFIDPSGMDSVSAQGQNSSSASSTTLVIPPPASAAGASAAGELLLKILGKAGWLLFFATTFPGDAPPAAMQEENTAEADAEEASSDVEKGRLSGETIEQIESGNPDWVKVSAHSEAASKKGAREQGVSVQEVFENKTTGERVVRHQVFDDKGKLVKTGHRPYYKPRAGNTK
jgi:RHS repeat-associated protein